MTEVPDLPNNSAASRKGEREASKYSKITPEKTEEQEVRERLDPIVTPGGAKARKPSIGKRFRDNFLAEDASLTERAFLLPPHSAGTQALLSQLIAENLAHSQQHGLFRDDIPAPLLGQCFTGMLVQLAQNSGDPALRHQHSVACAKLFCEGIWPGAA